MQIELYAEFEPARLLGFLQGASEYDPQKVCDLECHLTSRH